MNTNHPPIKCIPCWITMPSGERWSIKENGDVVEVTQDNSRSYTYYTTAAKDIRREARRLRRNHNERLRTRTMKDLELRRGVGGAFGGWE